MICLSFVYSSSIDEEKTSLAKRKILFEIKCKQRIASKKEKKKKRENQRIQNDLLSFSSNKLHRLLFPMFSDLRYSKEEEDGNERRREQKTRKKEKITNNSVHKVSNIRNKKKTEKKRQKIPS